MTLHTYPDLAQGSDEWLKARCGIVTASVIGKLITAGTIKPANNDQSRGLTESLVAERITGHVEPVFVTSDMQRGHEEEPLARDAYAQHTGQHVDEVGFMVREWNGVRVGYSPDGLVGDDGCIEIKSRRQRRQVSTVLGDTVPVENLAQCQAGLFVTGRKWLDYVSYSAGMAIWIIRVYPDPKWFAAIEQAAEKFENAATDMADRYLSATQGLPISERLDLELVI